MSEGGIESSLRRSRRDAGSFGGTGFDLAGSVSGSALSSSTRRLDGRGRHGIERARGVYARQGSMLHLRDDAGSFDDRSYRRAEFRHHGGRRGDRGFGGSGRADDLISRGFDDGDRGSSFVYYIDPALSPRPFVFEGGEGGPKIIDVEAERLDRRPIGPSGIDILQNGGAKIIRIAPGYRMADGGDRIAAGRPPVARATRTFSGDLQPWSSGWLTYCTQTYRTFDPDLGTYVGRDAKIRFCSAE